MDNKGLQGEEIYRLIPQRPPIVMIDRFYGASEERSLTGLTVSEENIFCAGGVLQESGIIEHIAQSAAARLGYICLQKNEPVPLGFIGSVDKLDIRQLPAVGSELRTEITLLQEVLGITLVGAQVKSGDTLIAECRMKIFLEKE